MSELKKLSNAATQGEWRISHRSPTGGAASADFAHVNIGGWEHAAAFCSKDAPEGRASAALAVRLVNAYRAGQLVEVEPASMHTGDEL